MQDATQAVRALEAEFERYANAVDAAMLADAFYAEGAQVLAPNAPPIVGKAAIRDFWSAFLAAGVTDIRLNTGEVTAVGDIAYGVGAYGYTTNGVRHEGKYVVVYHKQPDGGYKAMVDAFSSNGSSHD